MGNFTLAEMAKVDDAWKQLVAESIEIGTVERVLAAFPGATVESHTPDAE